MNKLARLLKLLIFCLGFLLILPSSASGVESPTAYQIEIIVYSHMTEAGLKSEYWPELPPMTIQPDTLELSAEQILPENNWRLKEIHRKLENNHYPILLHIAWQESADDLRKGRIIHLAGGVTYNNDRRQMDGTFSIFLQRYFNAHFNLRFLQNIVYDNNESENSFLSFKINENLRMRSNELNYIDHPLYGILIQINPITMVEQ